MITISPTLEQVAEKLRAFLVLVAPDGMPVVRGLDNLVPQPNEPYVLFTEITQQRITTNISTFTDPGVGVGARATRMGTVLTFQVDCYGPASADLANAIANLLRDDFGCRALAPVAQPLYAGEPRLMPLVNGEEQYERRWMLEAVLQWNPVASTPQQFADRLEPSVINVDERYPP